MPPVLLVSLLLSFNMMSADSPCLGICQPLALDHFVNVGSSLDNPTAHRGTCVPEQSLDIPGALSTKAAILLVVEFMGM